MSHTREWKLHRIGSGDIETLMTVKVEWEWTVKKALMVSLKSLWKYSDTSANK